MAGMTMLTGDSPILGAAWVSWKLPEHAGPRRM